MIRYIISKMMGVEGLLMLLPMMVGIIYGGVLIAYATVEGKEIIDVIA